jgi:hypothetical protein
MIVDATSPSLLRILPFALSLAACAPAASVPDSDSGRIEQRLTEIERRVEQLESRPPVQAPLRTREEIQKHRDSLLAERGKLLTSYTEQHPAIRDIDRQLRILDLQLKSVEP